jgi:hypothetical protein
LSDLYRAFCVASDGYRDLFTRKYLSPTLLMWLGFAMNSFNLYLLVSWLPILLTGAGWASTQAIHAMMFNQVGGIAGGISLAWLMDRFGAERTLAAGCVVNAVALALFLVVPSGFYSWGALLLVIGACTGGMQFAIISLAGIVFSRSLRVGGDEFDETIVAHMKRAYNLMIGERTAEEIKIRIGSAFPLEQELTMEVKGRDLSAGLPKTITIRSEEIREALQEPLSSILESIRITLERCPPELAADLVDRGIVMAGGGALLRGIDRLVAEETGLPVHIADDPLSAVAEGTGRVLQELQFLKRVTANSGPRA